jgi:hypothetical protein
MTARRSTRLVYAALALAAVGLIQLADIVLILATPLGEDPCSLDVFGVRFPSNGDGCYVPVGVPAVLAFGTFALAALVGSRRFDLAPLAGLAAGVIAVAVGGSLPAQDGIVTTTAMLVGLLGTVSFLVYVPTGPRARAGASRAWRIALVACGALFVLDTAFSGFMRSSPAGPQGAFVVAGALILAAGLWSGRLAAGEPGGAEIPAPADASPA